MTVPSSTIVAGPSHCYRLGVPKHDRHGKEYDVSPIGVTVWFRNWSEACEFAEEIVRKGEARE